MMLTFFSSEIRRAFRSPMLYIFFVLFALMSFGAVASDNVVIGGAVGNVYKNSPFIISQYTLIMGMIGILVAAAFFNNAALRDYNNQFNEILFSSPISKGAYFFGRFFGALVLATIPILGVFLGIVLGGILGPILGWVGAERIGPVMWSSFVQNYFVFALPNMFIAGAIIFGCANIWRSTIISFVAALSIIVLYLVSNSLLSDIENEQLAAMVDMLGLRSFSVHARYFTPAEKNTVTSLLSGLLISNRLIWLSIASGVLGLAFWRFSFKEKSKKVKKQKVIIPSTGSSEAFKLPSVKPSFGASSLWAQFVSFYKMNTLNIVKSPAFIILSIFAFKLLFFSLVQGFEYFGLQSFPVTYKMIDRIEGSTDLFILIITVFFSGEIVWRDRVRKIDGVVDATSHGSFVSLLAKTLSLVSLPIILYFLFTLMSIVYQLLNGYTRVELDVYLLSFFYTGLPTYFTWSAIFILLQVLVSNRYVGYFLSVLALIGLGILLSAFDIGTNMLDIGGGPGMTYSDMNGFGPGLEGRMWFNGYWMLFGVLMLFLAGFLWPRGNSNRLGERFKAMKTSFKGKPALAFAITLAAWLGVASFVYYNTQVLNTYQTGDAQEEEAVAYENTYKQYQGMLKPTITDVKHYIDIFPAKRDVYVKADFVVKNKHAVPISEIHFNVNQDVPTTIDIPGATLDLDDTKLGYRIYKLAQPLQPDANLTLHVETEFVSNGFENGTPNTRIIRNGTFLTSGSMFPSMGYNEGIELSDKNTRKKYDLKPKRRMPALAMGPCARQCMVNYLSDGNADWVNIETVISTSDDQIAIAPGSLVKEWKEGDRKYFNYVVDHPSQYFCNFVSADYEVHRKTWNGIDIEIYHDKKHTENVEMMADAVEKSFKYYTKNFGPYFHKQARIIEFPRYSTFAQAFPGTMPYSESFGFIIDLSDTTQNNVIDAVIAHEMAHQWWAHQEIPAKMQGGTMLTESFSEYSSLMVMKQEKTPLQMKNFLKYDFRRYLRGRSGEIEKEMPLSQVENQTYIHYGKGSVILYALQDYIGEDSVNFAMRDFLEEYRYKPPPYPNSNDFMRYLEPRVPDSLQYLIDDWFHTITLYDFRLKESEYTELANGKYEVTVDLEAYKMRADSLGNEEKVGINDWVDIGLYADRGEDTLLTVKRVKLSQPETRVSFEVDRKPAKAAVDPKRLLIERVTKDNVKSVKGK
ncbi:MAG: ABC transporter permease/M1 family aminopeptidase [Bacteroidia bacterium]